VTVPGAAVVVTVEAGGVVVVVADAVAVRVVVVLDGNAWLEESIYIGGHV